MHKKRENHNFVVTKQQTMILSIEDKFKEYFPNIKSTILKNVLIVALGIFKSKSVNLNEVKLELPSILNNKRTTVDSHYRRLTRFFTLPDEEKLVLSEALLKASLAMIGKKKKHLQSNYLTLDGTKWESGDTYLHLLSLCIVVNGVSIPIWWQDLSKKGHSSQAERLEFFKKALVHYNLKNKCLLADREYIGREWISFLSSNDINFVIRLRKGVYREEVDNWTTRTSNKETAQHLRYSALERRARLKKYARKGVAKEVWIEGRKYLLVIIRNRTWKVGDEPKEELLYLLTTLNKRTKAIKAYKVRWSIECCFKHLKSKGFDLEAVNVKGDEKIFLMVAIVSFMYTLCVVQGLLQGQRLTKSDFKTFSDGTSTLAKSYFKRGREILHQILFDIHDFVTWINLLFKYTKVPKFLFVQ